MTYFPDDGRRPAGEDATETVVRSAEQPVRRRLMTRRAVLGAGLITVAGGVAAYATDLLGSRTLSRWYSRAVGNYARAYTHVHLEPAERLVRHFDYLTLDPAGVTRFVADFQEHFGAVTPQAVAANRIFYTKYLMSTDFFLNGADESRVVRYVMLHDPYVSPCWNPFGSPDAAA